MLSCTNDTCIIVIIIIHCKCIFQSPLIITHNNNAIIIMMMCSLMTAFCNVRNKIFYYQMCIVTSGYCIIF